MFRVLMASQPGRSGWLSSTTFSTVAHGALITAAVFTTGGVTISAHETRATAIERVAYVVPRASEVAAVPRNAPTPPNGPPHAAANTAKIEVPDFAAVRDIIDRAIEAPTIDLVPDLTPMMTLWLTRPDALSTQGPSLSEQLIARAALARPENGIYDDANVEVGVAPKRGNPTPRYPAVLRDMGVEGSFVVRFVIDSTGTVPDEQITFPSSMHRLFADAVRAALHRSRYIPARVGGHPVAQLVAQEFRFEVRR